MSLLVYGIIVYMRKKESLQVASSRTNTEASISLTNKNRKPSPLTYFIIGLFVGFLLFGVGGYYLGLRKLDNTQISLRQPTSKPTSSQNITDNSIPVKNTDFNSIPLTNDHQIVYKKNKWDEDGVIWASDGKGKNHSKLIWSKVKSKITLLSWSPDGEKIAFIANTNPTRTRIAGLYIYNGVTNEIIFVSEMSSLSNKGMINSWSNNSKYLAYYIDSSSGKGPLGIYNLLSKSEKIVQITPKRFGGALQWDEQNNVYFIAYDPVTYCREATTHCQVLEDSKLASVYYLKRFNVENEKSEDLFSNKLSNGAIQGFILQNNSLLLQTRNNEVFKIILDSKKSSKIQQTYYIDDNLIISPDKKKYISNIGGGPGGPDIELVELTNNTTQKLRTYDDNDIIYVLDWYDNDTIIALDNSGTWFVSIDDLVKEEFLSEQVTLKVRPQSI